VLHGATSEQRKKEVMSRTVTVRCDDTMESKRVHLPAPAWTGHDEIGTGRFRTGVYIGTKNIVVETYSQWQQRDGSCEGTRYHIADRQEAAEIAGELPNLAEQIDAIIGVEAI
jgi:hypothetical protein